MGFDDEPEDSNYARASIFIPDKGHTHICGVCSERYFEVVAMIGKERVLTMENCYYCKDKTINDLYVGKSKYGKRIGDKDAKEIRRLFSVGIKRKYLSTHFKISLSAVNNIINNVTHRHLLEK